MKTPSQPAAPFPLVSLGHGLPPVCRLGLASRGNTHLQPDDVHRAIEAGVNYLNWCGHPDGMSRAIGELGRKRDQMVIAVQVSAISGDEMRREFDTLSRELRTDWVDIPTFYWMESSAQWDTLTAAGGGYRALQDARREGRARMLGLTSHQRRLAASIAASGAVDLLMIRYNAAHTGAERDVFPSTSARGLPVVAFTCLRWGALLQPTPEDPPGFVPPAAPAWYRWTLQHPAVSVALMAPDGREELERNLELLSDWRALQPAEWEALTAHGRRVRRHAENFP